MVLGHKHTQNIDVAVIVNSRNETEDYNIIIINVSSNVSLTIDRSISRNISVNS